MITDRTRYFQQSSTVMQNPRVGDGPLVSERLRITNRYRTDNRAVCFRFVGIQCGKTRIPQVACKTRRALRVVDVPFIKRIHRQCVLHMTCKLLLF